MLKTKQLQKGFTIVELLIVIVVIGILAALVISTFTGIQARARDTQRDTDAASIIKAAEAVAADRGNGYPSLADLKNSAVNTVAPLDSVVSGKVLTTNTPSATTQNVYDYETCGTGGTAGVIVRYWSETQNTARTKTAGTTTGASPTPFCS